MIERVYEPKVYEDKYIKNKSGIYQIRNLVNNKIYIGSAEEFYRRKNYEHFYSLKRNKHVNRKLQRAYNKYGEQNFIFEIIEFVEDESKLLEHEQYWMDRFNVVKNGYNIEPIAGRVTPQSRAVICLETNIVYKNSTEAGKYINTHRINISDCCKGERKTAKKLHFMYYDEYLHTSQEDIYYKIKQKRINKTTKIYCVELDKIYNSIKEAQKELNVNNITAVLSGVQNTSGGYHFITYEKYLILDYKEIEKIKNTSINNGIPVKLKCLNTNQIFNSYTEASKHFNIDRHIVSECCKKNKPTKNGLVFIKI